jgi:cation diffusion facilitator family transporter
VLQHGETTRERRRECGAIARALVTPSVRTVTSARATVYAAIAANVCIAITKFIAAIASGSSALFSEGMHSAVDTGDGLLLLLGMRLSRRPPTPRHPYGHGHEVYFWSMIVAMSVFGMGGGVSIYEGIDHVLTPHEPNHTIWSWLVLAIAFVFEGISWVVSLHGFRRVRGQRGVWEAIVRSKDPTTFAVVLEDTAALIGIVLAAAGIGLSTWLGSSVFDAIASIAIGALLVTVGIVLGRETWSLLIGESASHEVVEAIREVARAYPGVLDVQAARTLHVGPDVVHVDLDLRVDPSSSIIETTRAIEAAVHERFPQVHRISFRFPASATSLRSGSTGS